jgi:hypothetical protein
MGRAPPNSREGWRSKTAGARDTNDGLRGLGILPRVNDVSRCRLVIWSGPRR